MLGYVVKMNNLYNMESNPAYWRSVGDGCFEFTGDIKRATILSKSETEEIMKHQDSYCKMYAAENMEIVDLLDNPIPVNFKIDGRETSDIELIVGIPDEYRELFEGCNFVSKDQFSKATMYAHCAQEATFYNRPWIVRDMEHALKNLISQVKEV